MLIKTPQPSSLRQFHDINPSQHQCNHMCTPNKHGHTLQTSLLAGQVNKDESCFWCNPKWMIVPTTSPWWSTNVFQSCNYNLGIYKMSPFITPCQHQPEFEGTNKTTPSFFVFFYPQPLVSPFDLNTPHGTRSNMVHIIQIPPHEVSIHLKTDFCPVQEGFLCVATVNPFWFHVLYSCLYLLSCSQCCFIFIQCCLKQLVVHF